MRKVFQPARKYIFVLLYVLNRVIVSSCMGVGREIGGECLGARSEFRVGSRKLEASRPGGPVVLFYKY